MNFGNRNELVAAPSWGSFRKFWNECELTITPILKGFIDIEGGHVGFANGWFNTCFECLNSTKCNICGRNPSNSLQVRAGDGDGAYAVYEIKFEQEKVGGLVILDEFAEMASPLINTVLDLTGSGQVVAGDIQAFADDFYRYFYESIEAFDPTLNLLNIGEIDLNKSEFGYYENSGLLVIGEAGEGKDSNQSLVTFNDLQIGTYRFFAFGFRDESNANILIPRVVLFLRTDAADSIGLTSTFAPSINLGDELETWSNSIVSSRIGEPLAPVIIKTNLGLTQINLWLDEMKGEGNFDSAINQLTELEQSSWLLLLYHHLDTPESKSYAESIFSQSPGLIENLHKLRGQLGRTIYKGN